MIFLGACLLWACVTPAHHSFTNIYDSSKRIELQAVVTEFQFVHPHPFLLVKVDGVAWRAEMDNRFELEDIGMTAETFKSGDRVVLAGSPGRSDANAIYMWRLERPSDGLLYEQIGGTPSMRKR